MGDYLRRAYDEADRMAGLGCHGWTKPSNHEWHHYHAPTVEDLLREVIDKATNSTYTVGDILSEYGPKFKLAEQEGDK